MDEQTVTDSPEDRLQAYFSPKAATPKEEAAQDAPATDPAEEATEEVEATAESDEPEGEELEVEGEKYQLPPKLAKQVKEWKEGYTRRDDYTRKTQEVAAIHRQVSAIAETAQANEYFDKQIAPQKEELAYIKHQLDQFKKVDWMSLESGQHLALRAQMDQLKDREKDIQSDISEKQEGLKAFREQKRREVLSEGHKYLTQTIKGWGPDSVKEATSVAKEAGYSDDEIGGIMDARFVRVLWEAAQFRKGQAAKPSALAAVQKAPPVIKPGAVSQTTAAQKEKALRARLKSTGRVEDAYALFKTHMR